MKGVTNQNDASFPEEEWSEDDELTESLQKTMGLKTKGDLMRHMGRDLALRFVESDVAEGGKEAIRRELISPLLFTACALVGGVKVMAEQSIKGVNAHGNVDWVLIFKHYSIVVIEV